MAGALLGAVSCTPIGGEALQGANSGALGSEGAGRAAQQGSNALAGTGSSGARATSGELRRLREQREGVGREQLIHAGNQGSRTALGGVGGSSSPNASGGELVDAAHLPPLPPLNIDYRYAVQVPGRNGWVYNPYTNRPVDVRGVESGRLIYDERDPENRNEDGTLKPVAQMPNKFRVP